MRVSAGTETRALAPWVARFLASVLGWLLAACGGSFVAQGEPDASDAGGMGDRPSADARTFDGPVTETADGLGDDADGNDGNGCGDIQVLSSPVFSPTRGAAYSCQGAEVTIACPDIPPTGNGRIYYTTDGTLPTHESPVYLQPILLDMVGLGTIHAICSDPSDCFVDSVVADFTPLGPPVDCKDGGIVVPDAGGD